jgi:hypothetical protein
MRPGDVLRDLAADAATGAADWPTALSAAADRLDALDTAVRDALDDLRWVALAAVGGAVDREDVATLGRVCDQLREAVGVPEGGRLWLEGDPRARA